MRRKPKLQYTADPDPVAAPPTPPAAQAAPPPKPRPVITPQQATAECIRRARAGDRTVLPGVQWILDHNPKMWNETHHLARLAEQGWITQLAGKDLLLEESIRRQVKQLKANLAGDAPSPLDRLLIERIAATWLAVQHAELDAARDQVDGDAVSQMRLKRLDAANKRFLAATRALAVTRRLLGGMRIEIRHENASETGAAAGRCESVDEKGTDRVSGEPAVAGTLQDFFGTGLEDERRAMAGQD
jgi:hypothetical protein